MKNWYQKVKILLFVIPYLVLDFSIAETLNILFFYDFQWNHETVALGALTRTFIATIYRYHFYYKFYVIDSYYTTNVHNLITELGYYEEKDEEQEVTYTSEKTNLWGEPIKLYIVHQEDNMIIQVYQKEAHHFLTYIHKNKEKLMNA